MGPQTLRLGHRCWLSTSQTFSSTHSSHARLFIAVETFACVTAAQSHCWLMLTATRKLRRVLHLRRLRPVQYAIIDAIMLHMLMTSHFRQMPADMAWHAYFFNATRLAYSSREINILRFRDSCMLLNTEACLHDPNDGVLQPNRSSLACGGPSACIKPGRAADCAPASAVSLLWSRTNLFSLLGQSKKPAECQGSVASDSRAAQLQHI